MYLRIHPICEIDGCGQVATDLDHKKPKRDGGTDAADNLQALCHSHHSQKTARGM
jgi:5-methylcytosine-specific restriction protein A